MNFENRTLTAVLVYLTLLLDNMLLTVIVPILPDYLVGLQNTTAAASANRTAPVLGPLVSRVIMDARFNLQHMQPAGDRPPGGRLSEENGAIGVLLATKALVQLCVTPLVGNFAQRVGYCILFVMGTASLLVAAVGTVVAV